MAEVFKGLEATLAGIVARSGVMDEEAAKIEAVMRSVASGASVGPEFIEGITIESASRGKDRVIGTTDPLAVPKEMGHVIRNEGDGPVLGYVRGAHVISKTIARLPEVSGDG